MEEIEKRERERERGTRVGTGKGKRNERREKRRTSIDGKSTAVISIRFLSQNLSE